MVLQPLGFTPAESDGAVPAWPAVEVRQKQTATEYLLVTQPEHARLSGELAARFASPVFPALTPDAVQAIGLHDAGWAHFQGESSVATATPMLTECGKPRSFIEFAPDAFLQAWTSSIEHAAQGSALGGTIVSRHFSALARHALGAQEHSSAEKRLLTAFVRREAEREQELLSACSCPIAALDDYVKALQFCDLLSLALCCDVRESVEFPFQFGGGRVRMRFEGSAFTLSPSPFRRDAQAANVAITVAARRYSPQSEMRLTTLTLMLR
jgi:Protein of unknown function (DUF3891)